VLLTGLIGCSKDDDCPNCPTGDDGPYQGRVYVAMIFTQPGTAPFYVFDAATDSLLDSLNLDPHQNYAAVEVTPDGKYLHFDVITSPYGYDEIYDATTLNPVNTIEKFGESILVRGGTAILGSADGPRPQIWTRYIEVCSLPDCRVLAKTKVVDGYEWGDRRYDSYADIVYGVGAYNDWYSGSDTTDIFCYDLDSLHLVKRFRVTDETGRVYHINHILLDFKSGTGYALGFSEARYYLTFDIESGEVKNKYPMYGTYGDIQLSPDGSEVFVSDPGIAAGLDPTYNPGVIFIFDAATGDLSGKIPLPDFPQQPDLQGPPDVWQLRFTPDGSVLYGTSGANSVTGTVLKFDPKKRKFLGVLFPGIDRAPWRVAVGPPPVEQ